MMRLEILRLEPPTLTHPTPILFVHGAWHGAWCWQEHFLPYFAEHGYTAVALSLRGHGHSEGRDKLRWTRIADYAQDVSQVMNTLPRAPILVGHSMGGLIVQKVLETQSAAAAVLLASVPLTGVLWTTWQIAKRHPGVFLKANLTLSLYPVIGTPTLAREAFFSATMPADQVEAYWARLQDESYLAFLDMLALNLPRPSKITTPMLVLGAADDTLFRPEQIHAIARAYHTHAEIFPAMAHDMMLDAGWQTVADRILHWLAERGL